MNAHAVPILPCRSITATEQFYRELGFSTMLLMDGATGYLIMTLGGIELQFFRYEGLSPAANDHSAYIRCDAVDELAALFIARNLPAAGIPRFEAPRDRPWGMREAYLVDTEGNLLRIGQPIETPGARPAH